MAALVLAQLVLGWAAASWRLSPLKLDLFVWHKSLGILLLALVLLRLMWRLLDDRPSHPRDSVHWERLAALTVHAGIYGLLLALPVTGWVISSASNIPFRIFWLLPLPAIVGPDQAMAEQAARVHMGLVLLLSVLLAAHVAAALRHHYVRRNGLLLRMLTGKETLP